MQSKKLYAWETGPVDDRALALFCGDNPDFKVGKSPSQGLETLTRLDLGHRAPS
jgi:hypothetical protein